MEKNNFKIREWLWLWLTFLFTFFHFGKTPIRFDSEINFIFQKRKEEKRNLQPVFHIKIFIGNKILVLNIIIRSIALFKYYYFKQDFILLEINLLLFYAIWFMCVFFSILKIISFNHFGSRWISLLFLTIYKRIILHEKRDEWKLNFNIIFCIQCFECIPYMPVMWRKNDAEC